MSMVKSGATRKKDFRRQCLRMASRSLPQASTSLERTTFVLRLRPFREAGCEILGGLVFPADLRTLINQCAHQSFKPPVVTAAAGLLFASNVEAVGNLGVGMSTEFWWTPAFPFRPSLTGETSAAIAEAWEAKTGKQWTQQLGYSHAIWEIVIDTLKRSVDPLSREAIRDALKATPDVSRRDQVRQRPSSECFEDADSRRAVG